MHINSKIIIPIIIGITISFIPVPKGLDDPNAWYLFAIFFSAIISVIINATSILIASLLACSISILTNTIPPSIAFAGFSKSFILLIITAFILSAAFIKSGLGNRLSLFMVSKFGKTTLGLSYSLILTDMLIAPAFPSNTARSGVLYPLYKALSIHNGSTPTNNTEDKIGTYLMMIGITSLTLSSALWLTAMAANPAALNLAQSIMSKNSMPELNINFFTWFISATIPCLIAGIVTPYILYKIIKPTIKKTPEAPEMAKNELKKIGKMKLNEKIVAMVFAIMVLLWGISGIIPKTYEPYFEKTAIAILGLSILMITKIFTLKDFKKIGGNTLEIFIWFAILYSLSSALSQLGFMDWIGHNISTYIGDSIDPIFAYIILIVVYVLIHYFFVSQSAQAISLIPVFLTVALPLHINLELMTLMLLFATNFFAGITPQGSSANIIFLSEGYIKINKVYKYGFILTLSNLIIFLLAGTPWILFLKKINII